MSDNSRNPAQNTPRHRGPGRPFQPGNPGRPKGTRRKTSVLAEKLLGEAAEDVVKAVLNAARGGDMAAAKIVMDRIAPLRRGRPVAFDLPEVEGAAVVVEAFAAITKAVAAGELTPEEGAAVAAVLEAQRKAIEMVDFEARLTALEQRASQ